MPCSHVVTSVVINLLEIVAVVLLALFVGFRSGLFLPFLSSAFVPTDTMPGPGRARSPRTSW